MRNPEIDRRALSPINYPNHAEAYLGKKLLELLKLLDAVLEPYEVLFDSGLTPAQVTLALYRNRIFADLTIVREIADLLKEQEKKKRAELISRFGEARGFQKYQDGIDEALFPGSVATERKLRSHFIAEAGAIGYITDFLVKLKRLEQENKGNPENNIRMLLENIDRTDFQQMQEMVWHPERQAATISAWMRAYKNPKKRSKEGDMIDHVIDESEIQKRK